MKTLKNILLLIPMGIIGATIVYAAAPTGGYDPNATLNPDCAPADTDCFVKKIGKFVDGATSTDAVFTGGNVGIGTNTPGDYDLDVNGNARFGTVNQFEFTTNVLRSTATGANGSLLRSAISTAGNPSFSNVDDTDTGMFTAGSDVLGFTTGGSEAMRIDASGNVGIGTTNPSGKLSLRDTIEDTSLTLQSNNQSIWWFTADGTDGDNFLKIGGVGSTDRSTGAINITGGGDVGIGTNAPESKLQITESNSGGDVTLRIQNSASTAGDTATLRFSVTSNDTFDSAFVGSDRDNALILGSSAAERIRIDNQGNVGIGTTSPNSRLSVVGLPSGTNDSVTTGNLAGAVCITDAGNMYVDTDGTCAN